MKTVIADLYDQSKATRTQNPNVGNEMSRG